MPKDGQRTHDEQSVDDFVAMVMIRAEPLTEPQQIVDRASLQRRSGRASRSGLGELVRRHVNLRLRWPDFRLPTDRTAAGDGPARSVDARRDRTRRDGLCTPALRITRCRDTLATPLRRPLLTRAGSRHVLCPAGGRGGASPASLVWRWRRPPASTDHLLRSGRAATPGRNATGRSRVATRRPQEG
jgi:hypothetical protein